MNHELKPFDRVLVYHKDGWKADIFSHYINDKDFPYRCVSDAWRTCIPFKGNEALLGTHKSTPKEFQRKGD